MFGRKKLKRIINNLQISRDGWAETVVALSKEAKELKAEIETLRKSRNEWVKIADDKNEEIKSLKDENAKLKLEDERWRTQTESLVKEIESRDNTIKTLESEVERLTRKRDAKGRYVKMRREFKVGDKVRIKDGISSDTHYLINPGFVSEMDKYIGKTEVIKRLSEKGYVYLSDNIPTLAFHPDWLEHAD